MLRRWAETSPVEREAAATRDQLAKHLSFLAASLPSKNIDEESGRMRATVYASILGDVSASALAYMSRTACQTLDWFPTPRQCLDILRGYQPPVSDQETALRLCHQFTQGKFEQWLGALGESGEIGDVPDQWKRIAAERGLLRRMPDGSFVKRKRSEPAVSGEQME